MTKNQKITIGAVLVVSAGALIYSLATYKGHPVETHEPVAEGPSLSDIVLNEQNSPATPLAGETPGGAPGTTGTIATVTPGTPVGGPAVPPIATVTSTVPGTSATPGTPVTPVATLSPTETTEPAKVTYTVKKGDTLMGIAKRELGSENKWKEILAANPSLNPSKLKIGMTLQMPAKAGTSTAATPAASSSAGAPTATTGGFTPVASTPAPTPSNTTSSSTTPKTPKTTAATPKNTAQSPTKVSTRDGVQIYTVRNGDTLRSISKEVYRGDEQKWESVFRLNRDVIGSDPGRLEPGTILILPASGR